MMLVRYLDRCMVNVVNDTIVVCWVDFIVSEVGAHYQKKLVSRARFFIIDEDCWETIGKEGCVGRRALARC